MKKIKLRKRKRKVYFEYYPWIPLRYHRGYCYTERYIGRLNGLNITVTYLDDIEE